MLGWFRPCRSDAPRASGASTQRSSTTQWRVRTLPSSSTCAYGPPSLEARCRAPCPSRLDVDPLQIPDVPRDRPIVAYCLCSGETSSSRVARWLVQEGYRDVAVLTGGLSAWIDAGYEIEPTQMAQQAGAIGWKEIELTPPPTTVGSPVITPETAFLPGQGFLDGRELPMTRDMVLVFVDMVESTELVLHHSSEEVLKILQSFMEVVIDVGWYHCGDVHDFEGDGALLYFQGPGEALPAAFHLRDELVRRHQANPEFPLPRVSLDAGPVMIGIVGTRFRQTVVLVGPAVHRAARILKLAPPGGIVTTASIITDAARTHPDLAERFERMPDEFVLDERHPDPAPLWVSPQSDADQEPEVERIGCCQKRRSEVQVAPDPEPAL